MARPDSEQTPQPPAQGVQYGHGNVQYNYFAPVTWNLFAAGLERLQDVCFDPPILDLAHFTGRKRLISQIEDFIGSRVGNRDFIASVGDDHTVLVRQHPTR